MKIVKGLAVALLVTTSPAAFADEPPSDDGKGCASGQTELGLGLVAALAVMRRRSVTPERGQGTKPPTGRA